ncbi:hypothetical protein E2542_SST29623 [Spatholobus suberectus]|nr:hypothetical protein E2542_SST29623 [Spatholobus suberectus]
MLEGIVLLRKRDDVLRAVSTKHGNEYSVYRIEYLKKVSFQVLKPANGPITIVMCSKFLLGVGVELVAVWGLTGLTGIQTLLRDQLWGTVPLHQLGEKGVLLEAPGSPLT